MKWKENNEFLIRRGIEKAAAGGAGSRIEDSEKIRMNNILFSKQHYALQTI